MIGAFIPAPQGLEFDTWAALVVEQLADIGVMSPVSESHWRDWACSLQYSPELAFVPTPDGFDNWRDWAERVADTTI